MRVTIFIISCLFSLLVAFGFIIGDGDYQYMIHELGALSLALCVTVSTFFILTFKFIKKKAGTIKKWQRVILLILIPLNILFWSILIFLRMSVYTISRWLGETYRLSRDMYRSEAVLFIAGFVISLIILLPPILYLIKPRKKIKPER